MVAIMTLEAWFEKFGDNIPFSEKEIGISWELLSYFWDIAYKQGIEDGSRAEIEWNGYLDRLE